MPSMQTALVILAAVAVAGLALAMWAFQTFGVYRFPDRSEGPAALGLEGVRAARFVSEDGAEVGVWLAAPAEGKPVIISFFGNFSAVGPSALRLKPMLDKGYGMALLEYRGSGGAPGTPSEEAFAADARALYDQLDTLLGETVPAGRRVIHGFSLGSGIAVRLGVERPARAVIAEAGYASLTDYFANRYRPVPFGWMWRERFDAVRRVPQSKAPVMVAIGARDASIPEASARALFAAAPDPKRLAVYPDGHHADLIEHGLWRDVEDFLQSLP